MTPYKSILVHLDSSPRCAARLAVAQQLAVQHDGQVTALFAASPINLQYPFGFAASMDAATLVSDIDTQRRSNAKAVFDAAVASGMTRLRWTELPFQEPLAGFSQRACYADLLVLGQHDPASGLVGEVPSDFVEWTLSDSGRPALVLPYVNVPVVSPARSVLVAWKACRESARAVSAALPLLQAAQQVHVAVWDGGSAQDAGAGLALQTYLQQHGVASHLHNGGPASADLGDLLLSLASDLDAGLLVMGCYGHARLREWVTGGATRTVLASMTLPVLMSH